VNPEGVSLPFAGVSDVELWNMQVLQNIICGRNHSALAKKRREYACRLARPLKIEADLRGLPSPQPPYGVGQFRHDPDGAL